MNRGSIKKNVSIVKKSRRRRLVFSGCALSMLLMILDAISRTPYFSIMISIFESDWKQKRCLLNAHDAFKTLNVSWFITFGSALFYHRGKAFDSRDVDTALFYHDLLPVADRLVDSFRDHGFHLLSSFGSLEHGKEWTFRCPWTFMKMDIFIFYPPLRNDSASSSFAWWTATYGGEECDRKRYKKCRLQFSSIELEEIMVDNKTFRIVPIKSIIEHYGESWKTPISYNYYESMPFLHNIINE